MKRHRMQLPREVIVGEGTLDSVTEVFERLGFSESALVVTGHKTMEVAGKTVIQMLEDRGVKVDSIIVDSSALREVQMVEAKIREEKPQVVFGIGGGTKIDVAKVSSAYENVPFISVPTTASHDGIASPVASLKGFRKPYSVMAQAPLAIIADTEIIMKAPKRFSISGCGDVVAKLTAVRDWELAHKVRNEYYGEYAASLALMSAQLIMENAELIKENEEEGLRVLLEALISCGVAMSIAGSSRPCSGSEHLFSHALDLTASKHALHGEQCGVGTIMMAFLHGINWKNVKKTLETLEAPTTASDLGITVEELVRALVEAKKIRPERYTILNEVNMDAHFAEKLAKNTGVIE
ncbi:MAG TPA: NAD(P)-dependent glycerol-1-phosphate dehydrogenase [Candidatus Bathyarchaeota archaeon]|nr:MAG: NAD(P)-dependent glycerol-1-phosphate dehydrogenase [Candidatus Bathyarchaeota archaeon]HDI06786.1 NAD(P)-dependent glycerol-1-phosphate dehydrogenase [Candidatus Bathyarchaeota archaeon]